MSRDLSQIVSEHTRDMIQNHYAKKDFNRKNGLKLSKSHNKFSMRNQNDVADDLDFEQEENEE